MLIIYRGERMVQITLFGEEAIETIDTIRNGKKLKKERQEFREMIKDLEWDFRDMLDECFEDEREHIGDWDVAHCWNLWNDSDEREWDKEIYAYFMIENIERMEEEIKYTLRDLNDKYKYQIEKRGALIGVCIIKKGNDFPEIFTLDK